MSHPNRDAHAAASPPRHGAAEPRPFIVVVTGPHFGKVLDLVPGREAIVGSSADADLVIQDHGIAPRHVRVTAAGGGMLVTDLGSESGTYVDGVRVAEAPLADGARFSLGPHTVLKLVASQDVEAQYQRRLAEGALHEPLTGLYNRRHFLDRLASELAAAQRHGRALSLLAIDVDRFAQVNETHGPLAGDEALKVVALVLQGAIRKEDVVARSGGEQFFVLARETGLTGARALAERIRRAVERSRSAYGGAEIALTVSVGVTVSIGLAQFEPGRTVQQMVESAERALRQAKESGRNSVVAAPPLPG